MRVQTTLNPARVARLVVVFPDRSVAVVLFINGEDRIKLQENHRNGSFAQTMSTTELRGSNDTNNRTRERPTDVFSDEG